MDKYKIGLIIVAIVLGLSLLSDFGKWVNYNDCERICGSLPVAECSHSTAICAKQIEFRKINR